MPAAAIAPLMLMVGRGVGGTNIVVVVLVSFPDTGNLMRGLRAPDPTTLGDASGASRWQQIRMLRAPFSLPYLFTGLRIARRERDTRRAMAPAE